ncbi:hypothetical protein [Methylotuvimicrobium sp. KM2]|uniref:hypothetical protein n=1 Tax=Methylotuvimicrobium sp. KM2 TaxID=3133976 RepID=UPI003100E4D7
MTTVEDKIGLIRERFAFLVGKEILGCELAQLWIEEDKEWSDWMDLPLFLCIGDSALSISWQKFDELAIENERVLPFTLCGSTVRWLCESIGALDNIVGRKIVSVSLGRGEMSIGEKELEIWSRLLIELTGGIILEVFNALDENGIEVHTVPIAGETLKCI